MTLPPAEPFYFTGPRQRPLFGWLHLPEASKRINLGVVICNPLGFEEICAHRSLRQFAEALVAMGISVLRFDYDGTGDSAGDDFDSERLAAWTASVNAAADTLRQLSGIEHLCFIGLRFGATLAALAGAQRSDVVAQISIAAVISGRTYVRELRALQLAIDNKEGGEAELGELLESAGFILSNDTQRQLSEINLAAAAAKPASRVLIIERTDLSANQRWPMHLRSLGADVTQVSIDGYVEMMLAPHESVVPIKMIEASVEWLQRVQSELGITSLPLLDKQAHADALQHIARMVVNSSTNETTITEEAVFIDPQSRLFGVISAPAAPKSLAPGVHSKVIVLLTSGAVHRVGPNRVYATLARNWAALGYVALRVDISGIGDSPPRPGEAENVVYSRSAQQDVEAILRYVDNRYGLNDCHATGICSGAYHAFKAAVKGAPLKSVALINPLTYFWKEGMTLQYPAYRVAADVERYKTNMFRGSSWLKLLRGNVNIVELCQVLLRQCLFVARHMTREFLHLLHIYSSEDLAKELEVIAGHSIGVSFVFSAQDPGRQLLQQQGGNTVKRLSKRGKLHIDIVDQANHTFTSLATRERLVAILTQHFNN